MFFSIFFIDFTNCYCQFASYTMTIMGAMMTVPTTTTSQPAFEGWDRTKGAQMMKQSFVIWPLVLIFSLFLTNWLQLGDKQQPRSRCVLIHLKSSVSFFYNLFLLTSLIASYRYRLGCYNYDHQLPRSWWRWWQGWQQWQWQGSRCLESQYLYFFNSFFNDFTN